MASDGFGRNRFDAGGASLNNIGTTWVATAKRLKLVAPGQRDLRCNLMRRPGNGSNANGNASILQPADAHQVPTAMDCHCQASKWLAFCFSALEPR
jgi:hypothetical protein